MAKQVLTDLVLVALLAALAALSLGAAPLPQTPARKTLLVVLAHPDDEITIAPLLSAYARRGTRVHLVVVTDGEKGVTDHARIPAGPGLARVRAEEVRCSCAALGIEAPTLLGFKDGELGQISSPVWGHLAEVRLRIAKVVETLHPDAIITYGPEGGYGHTDHRLVGALVTELVQAGAAGAPQILLYPGFPKARLTRVPSIDPPWAPTDERFLTVRVPFDAADMKAARTALGCHKSQFPESVMDPLVASVGALLDGKVYLRPWFGAQVASDIFEARGR